MPNFYRGIIDMDYILNDLDEDNGYIVNTGNHWIAVYNNNYIDSFGRDKLLSHFNSIDNTPNQYEKNKNCGQHALTSLLLIDKYGLKEAKKILTSKNVFEDE